MLQISKIPRPLLGSAALILQHKNRTFYRNFVVKNMRINDMLERNDCIDVGTLLINVTEHASV